MFDKVILAQAVADRGRGMDAADWEFLDAGRTPVHAPTPTDVRTAVASPAVFGLPLATVLTARRELGRSDSEVVDHVRGWARNRAHAHAMLLLEVAELMGRRDSLPESTVADPVAHEEFVAAEVGAALRLSPAAAQDLVDQAGQLVRGRLGATFDALLAGHIDESTARVIMVETACVADEALPAVEAAALGRARDGGTAAQVRHLTRRAAVKLDPASAGVREAAARTGRRVGRGETYDGVTELHAVLPVGDADRVWSTVDARARAMDDDGRSLDEKRADALVALVTEPAALQRLPGPVRYADVTVALSTLSGRDQEPGHLAGYGPVTSATARELAAGSTLRGVLVDDDGHVLARSRRRRRPETLDALAADALAAAPSSVASDRYRPTASLVDHVDAVHRRCRFVGCRRPARHCDKDHVHAWRPDGRGGRTCAKNLIPLCRFHHRMKHSPGWSVRLQPDLSVTWTTPTRHQWTDPPPTAWD